MLFSKTTPDKGPHLIHCCCCRSCCCQDSNRCRWAPGWPFRARCRHCWSSPPGCVAAWSSTSSTRPWDRPTSTSTSTSLSPLSSSSSRSASGRSTRGEGLASETWRKNTPCLGFDSHLTGSQSCQLTSGKSSSTKSCFKETDWLSSYKDYKYVVTIGQL